MQFHYAAGKINPENVFWHVMVFLVTIKLTDSCLAGCPKLTFSIPCGKLYFIFMCMVVYKRRKISLLHSMSWTQKSFHTFLCCLTPSVVAISTSGSWSLWCKESRLQTEKANQYINLTEHKSFSIYYYYFYEKRETYSNSLMCFNPVWLHCYIISPMHL